MNFEEAATEAKKMSGLGVFRDSAPNEELVCSHPGTGTFVRLTGETGYQQPGKVHKEATDWRVVLHVEDKVKNLGDRIRQAAAAGHVDDSFKTEAKALGDVDRLKLWGWSIREGITQDAMAYVHRCLTLVVMDVFKVPVGEAGVGVAPSVSRELDDFWSKTDPMWKRGHGVKIRDV